jgi:hypothetical protein
MTSETPAASEVEGRGEVNKTRILAVAAVMLGVVVWFSCMSNHRPDIPARPTGPAYCFKDTTYAFQTVVSDPDGDSMVVRFDWGDSSDSHWMGWFASGDTVASTHVWSDTGNYEVRVSAQDRERTSDLSDGLTVRVAIRWPPETPAEPAGPSVGGRDTLYTFTSGADHPDNVPVAIRFAWGDGDTSDWSEFVPSGGPVSMSHAWTGPDTYAIAAQAKDTGELTSLWSSPHTIVVRPPGWSGLGMVGAPTLAPDSSGLLIRVVNVGTVEDTVRLLEFYDTPESAYMRDFRIQADHCGYPIPDGMPGTGPGDTVRFTVPVTIAPNATELVELYFGSFCVDEVVPPRTQANVHGKQFVFRFDDGSVIVVNP